MFWTFVCNWQKLFPLKITKFNENLFQCYCESKISLIRSKQNLCQGWKLFIFPCGVLFTFKRFFFAGLRMGKYLPSVVFKKPVWVVRHRKTKGGSTYRGCLLRVVSTNHAGTFSQLFLLKKKEKQDFPLMILSFLRTFEFRFISYSNCETMNFTSCLTQIVKVLLCLFVASQDRFAVTSETKCMVSKTYLFLTTLIDHSNGTSISGTMDAVTAGARNNTIHRGHCRGILEILGQDPQAQIL